MNIMVYLFPVELRHINIIINESDSSRTEVNVKLGRDVIVVKAVKKGEQFFADYGVDYVREY